MITCFFEYVLLLKMKLLVFICLICASSELAFGNEEIGNFLSVKVNNTFSGHPFLEAICSIYSNHKLDRVKELCTENGGERAFDELVKQTNSFDECLRQIPLFTEIELPSKLCKDKLPKLKECFDASKDRINVCEKKEEKFLTDFLSESVISMLHYSCSEFSHLLNGLTQNMEGLDCLAVFVQERNKSLKESLFSCMKEVQHKEIPEPHFTKARYCKRITDSKDCTLNLVKKWCSDNKNLKDFVVGLAGAAKSPCRDQ